MSEGIDQSALYDQAVRLLGDQERVEATDSGVAITIERTIVEGREALNIIAKGNRPVVFTRDSGPTQNGLAYPLGHVRDWIHDAASVVAMRGLPID